MKIWTLDDILKTEHLGDEEYVRVEELEQLKKEKEEYRIDNCMVNDERAHVQGRNMVLKEALKKYGKHQTDIRGHPCMGVVRPTNLCTCGFFQALGGPVNGK